MTNELQCLTSRDVRELLRISDKTLYAILRKPDHPVAKARIPGFRPYRFKQRAIMEYVGITANKGQESGNE